MIGQRMPGYEILEKPGEGGMGIVNVVHAVRKTEGALDFGEVSLYVLRPSSALFSPGLSCVESCQILTVIADG